jgi:hypothetical protein
MFGTKQAVVPVAQTPTHKPSGVEIMLRSLGLGDTLNEIKRIVDSGALDEIVRFAAEAKAIRETNEKLLAELAALRRILENGRSTLPGPGSDNGLRDGEPIGSIIRTIGAD